MLIPITIYLKNINEKEEIQKQLCLYYLPMTERYLEIKLLL